MKVKAKKRSSSPDKVAQLKLRLESFLARAEPEARIPFDPIEFPHRYSNPRDVEVVALLSACLAYGRVDLFKPKIQSLLAQMGRSPSRFVQQLDVAGARTLLDGFVYRFNLPTDVAVLLMGMGQALERHGSLEALFLEGYREEAGIRPALSAFTAALRDVPMAALRKQLGPERGLGHLLPSPLGPGAAKRLNLYLRWMVRGPDTVDFGIWKRVPTSALVIPLDTHIHRMATNLGMTRRKDNSWRTAEEITAALRAIDPVDPVRFDFALCHYGMSGLCPSKPVVENCRVCELQSGCGVGPKLVAAATKLSVRKSASDG